MPESPLFGKEQDVIKRKQPFPGATIKVIEYFGRLGTYPNCWIFRGTANRLIMVSKDAGTSYYQGGLPTGRQGSGGVIDKIIETYPSPSLVRRRDVGVILCGWLALTEYLKYRGFQPF